MSKRILVIDDSPPIRKSFILALEDTEYIVDTAESGEEGIKSHRQNKYDLIFVDLKMPGMDGIKATRQLRKVTPDVPIYIITAFHAEFVEQLITLVKEGIKFQFIGKPVPGDDICTIVKRDLEGPRGF